MACPRCDATMQGIGTTADGRRHFWCPRCGALRSVSPTDWTDDATPAYVVRRSLLVGDVPGGMVREASTDQEALNAYVWYCTQRRLSPLLASLEQLRELMSRFHLPGLTR